MFTIDIKLVRSDTIKPAEGWYFPGFTPEHSFALAAWLSELGKSLSAYPIAPKGTLDLVLLTSSSELGWSKSLDSDALQGAVGLTKLEVGAGRALWIPVNAEMFPALPSDKLLDLLSVNSEVVDLLWLPSTGLIGFEATDRANLNEFFETPKRSTEEEFQSPPEVSLLPKAIQSFSLLHPPTIEELFKNEQDEIGGSESDLESLEEEPDKPKGFLETAKNKLRRQTNKVLKQLKEVTDARGQSQSGAANSSSGIGAGIAGFVSRALEKQRQEQIDKLLRLMSKDPDRALKFAIPLGSHDAPRGLANPGSELTARNTNFSLSSMRGGGPADYWDLGESLRQRLLQSYREQANREMALGRYHRAAYIFAHLLGDLRAAAGSLENGNRFSEAAALYEELSSPKDQARCLQKAGRYNEAAAIYRRLGDFETSGEMWLEIGEVEAAHSDFELASELALKDGKPVKAAKIIDGRLGRRSEAQELLWSHWPNHPESFAAARQAFAWYAQDAEHGKASERLRFISNAGRSQKLATAKLAADVGKNYPEKEVQWQALDVCRLACAESSNEHSFDLPQRLQHLQTLSHLDPMLKEDVARHATRRKQLPRKAAAKKTAEYAGLKKLNSASLPLQVRWCHATAIGAELLAIGRHEKSPNRLVLARVSHLEQPNPHIAEFSFDVPNMNDSILPLVHRESNSYRIGLCCREQKLEIQQGRQLDHSTSREAWALDPDVGNGITAAAMAVSPDETLWYWSSATLHAVRENEHRSFDLSQTAIENYFSHDENTGLPESLVTIGSQPFLARGKSVYTLRDNMVELVYKAYTPLINLAVSKPHTRSRLALATENSLEILPVDGPNNAEHIETVVWEEQFTHVCFLHAGRLAATTNKELHIFQRNQNHRMEKKGAIELRQQPIVGLSSLNASTLAIAYGDGEINSFLIR